MSDLRDTARGMKGRMLGRLSREVTTLREENARLQAALKEIADGFHGGETAAVMLQETAREALGKSATANEEQ